MPSTKIGFPFIRALRHVTPSPRTRRFTLLLVLLLPALVYTWTRYAIPYQHVYNAFGSYTGRHFILPRPFRVPPGGLGTPPLVAELLCSPPPEGYPTPRLSAPTYDHRGEICSTAWLMLHIPSTNSPAARKRRNLIRTIDMLAVVPRNYRHLVEIKFILRLPTAQELGQGLSEYGSDVKDTGTETGSGDERGEDRELQREKVRPIVHEELEIREESRRYGDIVRLKRMEGGENMDHGKSVEWLRWVGRRERAGIWVIKCDDDMLPILPNLLPLLLQRDPSRPTYFGSHLGAFVGTHYHFEGMMYGLSWNVVKTISMAPLSRTEITKFFPEDGRIGELMYSLPSASRCAPPDSCSANASSVGQVITPMGPARPTSHHPVHPPSLPSDPSRPPHLPLSSSLLPIPKTRRLPPYPPLIPPPHLPTLPHSASICDPRTPPSPARDSWDVPPLSPDPRTGLVRWDTGRLMGRWTHWWIAGPTGSRVTERSESWEGGAVGYHYLKTDAEYARVYQRVLDAFRQKNREWRWDPPEEWKAFAAEGGEEGNEDYVDENRWGA